VVQPAGPRAFIEGILLRRMESTVAEKNEQQRPARSHQARPHSGDELGPAERAAEHARRADEHDRELRERDEQLEQISQREASAPREPEQTHQTSRSRSRADKEPEPRLEAANAELKLAHVQRDIARVRREVAKAQAAQARAEGRAGIAHALRSMRGSGVRLMKSPKFRVGAYITLGLGAAFEAARIFSDPNGAVVHAGAAGAMAVALAFIHRFYGQHGRLTLQESKQEQRKDMTDRMTDTYDVVDFDFKNDRYKGRGRRSGSNDGS
jgi:hypothetical protein